MDKKSDSGISLYIPMVLITAFLLGALSVSLLNVRENVYRITGGGSVSESDISDEKSAVRKSHVYEDNGLRYRMVSSSDLGLGDNADSQVKQASASPVSSQEEDSDREEDENQNGGLELPYDHYINFVPARKGYTAYLTFDDGPSENTEAILDILDYYNVKATFFVIYHENMEDKYKAIVDAGHTIALHSYTHNYKKLYSGEAAFFKEMEDISDFLYSLTGVRTKLMRFPGGSSNTVAEKYCKGLMPVLKKSVTEKGYVYQDWNVDSCDAEKANTSPKMLLSNISESLKEYKTAVVLMHDAGKSTDTTVEALPQIIEFFYGKGYSLEKMDLTTEEIHHNW